MFLASENIDFTGLAHVFLLGGGEASAFLFLSAGGNRSRKLFLRQYVFFLRSSYRLALYDCFCRTNTCACSAVYTCISVDHILAVSLRNCLYRTFASAGSAAYALVSNYICHVFFLLLLFRLSTYVFDLSGSHSPFMVQPLFIRYYTHFKRLLPEIQVLNYKQFNPIFEACMKRGLANVHCLVL